MARRRYHRRHAALAEYGEPFGDVGFFGDFFNLAELKEFGLVAVAGMGTAALAPRAVNLLDNLAFLGKWRGWAKGAAGVLGGYFLYKYGGRKVPAKYRDMIVASSAVLAGLGAAQIGHELFDKTATAAKVKGLMGLSGDLFPLRLGDVGVDEGQLLAALGAVEDQMIGDMTFPGFGADQSAPFGGWDANIFLDSPEMPADPSGAWDADINAQGMLDASVSEGDVWGWENEVDLQNEALAWTIEH